MVESSLTELLMVSFVNQAFRTATRSALGKCYLVDTQTLSPGC